MFKYILAGLFLILTTSYTLSQIQPAFQQTYMQGKEMYDEGRYDMAMEILKPLTLSTNKSIYSPFAAYYYSLAAFEKGYTYLAEEMLKNTVEEYKSWENVDLARLWLAKIYFIEEDYQSGMSAINDIVNPKIKRMANDLIKSTFADQEDVEMMAELYSMYPNIDGLAIILADRISSQPLMEQDRDLLFSIIEKFNLDKDRYDFIEDFESIKKSSYNVAVLMPFMVRDIIPSNLRRSNQFVLDIYEGIKTGVERLRAKGININVYAYDTERDADKTQRLIDSGELDGMDLLIGPLYPETVKLISEFSLKKRINMFNPLSSTSDLIANNPFSFLFRPTTESMALAVADYIISYKTNKNAMIFYEDNARDSLMAFTYKAAIEADSFNVVLTQKITGLDTISVYNTLTRKVRFDDMIRSGEDSMEIIDRYNLYDYFERLRRIRNPEDLRKIRPLELLVIPPDSIGHIFVATNRELTSASTISGMETRGDSITVIGTEDWLEYRSIALSQMESMDIRFISPGYIASDNPRLQDVYQKTLYTINKSPSKYHYLGYELINFVGEMMYEYGIYFQTGLRYRGIVPGILYQGFDYSSSNDNRLIPIIEFRNSQFSISNY